MTKFIFFYFVDNHFQQEKTVFIVFPAVLFVNSYTPASVLRNSWQTGRRTGKESETPCTDKPGL